MNKKATLDLLCFPSRTMYCMGPSPHSNVCDCRSILATLAGRIKEMQTSRVSRLTSWTVLKVSRSPLQKAISKLSVQSNSKALARKHEALNCLPSRLTAPTCNEIEAIVCVQPRTSHVPTGSVKPRSFHGAFNQTKGFQLCGDTANI